MTDHEALRLYAQTNDARAFHQLVEMYQRLVYAAARRRLGRSEDIEDVVQTTFLKLSAAAGTITRDLPAWLYTTAINTANDLIRRDATRRRHEAAAAADRPLEEDDQKIEWHRLSLLIDQVLLELPQNQQKLIVEHFFAGRSQRDLAAELNVSQPTILRRIDSAIADLRTRLAQRGYPASPLLAAGLQSLSNADVPQTLTTELAKIGISGARPPLAAPRPFSVTAHPFISVLAAVAALAAIGVWIAHHQLVQPASHAGPASAPAATQPAPPDKRTPIQRLSDVYALSDGQIIRRIRPPFPAQREAVVDAQYPYAKGSNNVHSLGFFWDHGELSESYMQYPDAELQGLIDSGLRIEWYHLDHLDRIVWQPGRSDWVVRGQLNDTTRIAERLGALAEIITADTGQKFRFEHHVVKRPCILLGGQVRPGPENKEHFHIVAISLKPLTEDEMGRWVAGQRPRNTTHRFSFQPVAQILDAPFLGDSVLTGIQNNMFYIAPDAQLDHTATDFRPKLQQVLENLKTQIGGTWSIEDREIDTWEATQP
jgi:RNA polymerase sigma-70 factor (ECF subfamily)